MWVLLSAAAMVCVILRRWTRTRLSLMDFLGIGFVAGYARFWHRWTCNGLAPIPENGPAILVSNHTCSSDPAFLTTGCRRVLSFMIGREFYHVPLLKRLLDYMGCVPVTRNGRDARSIRLGLLRLKQGRVVCIFPEGGLSHAGKGRSGSAKAGVALLALRSGVPVYPAFIAGGPQTSELLRAWLGRSRVHVIFGAPIDLSCFHGRPLDRKLLEETTAYIMERISLLRFHRNKEPADINL